MSSTAASRAQASRSGSSRAGRRSCGRPRSRPASSSIPTTRPASRAERRGGSLSLVANALLSGLLLAGFYAAVAVGLSISFGMLDIVNIAHPAFIVLGAYVAWFANHAIGADPIVTALVLSPAFFVVGQAVYRIYHVSFERHGQESLRGLAFFFGILFITEVALSLAFGVDYRLVTTSYSAVTWRLGAVDLPLRLLLPFVVSLAMTGALHLLLSRTFFGRALSAVSQDPLALQLMGVDPQRIR